MAFGFGGDLSVDRSFSGRSAGFAGLGRTADSILGDRSVAFSGDQRGGASGSSRGAGGGFTRQKFGKEELVPLGDDFFGRQKKREALHVDIRKAGGQAADLSGFRPGDNPELGGSQAREDQASAIERASGSALAAFARGDFRTGFDLTARNVGAQLGITEELAVDPATGAFGTRGTFNPVSLLANMPLGAGLLTAAKAAQALGPWSATGAVLDALGQRRTVQAVGGVAPTIDLGFRPASTAQRRAQASKAAGAALSAVDQLALDYAERRDAAIAARQRSRDAGRGDPAQPPPLLEPLPLALPSRPAANTATPPRGFGRLSGRDPRTGVDFLRTGEQAAIAAGLLPPRPTVGGVRSPVRPGALI